MIWGIVIAAALVLYFGLLAAAAGGGGERYARDRWRMLTLTLEAVLVVLAARVVVPWGSATRWLWVLAVAVLFALAARAALRAGTLPWLGGEGAIRRMRIVAAPLYAVLLAAINALLLVSLV